jgi:uncharacterized protein with HEPN domain
MLEHAREAVALADGKTRAHDPQIPWREITAMRHRLAHGYDAVDLDILWDTIHEDLAPLIAQLEAIVNVPGER